MKKLLCLCALLLALLGALLLDLMGGPSGSVELAEHTESSPQIRGTDPGPGRPERPANMAELQRVIRAGQ